MARQRQSAPPRPLAPGDVVATFSEELQQWTAAQVTDLDIDTGTAGVLDLDWAGPEPATLADLGAVVPLRLTHHNFAGQVSHVNLDWLLPRGYKIIGNLQPLAADRSRGYAAGWHVGLQLAIQRRWDSGDRGPWDDPRGITSTGAQLGHVLSEPSPPRPEIYHLAVHQVDSLDCSRLVARYPGLTRLSLRGNLGTLIQTVALNQLASLRTLFIGGLFGMGKQDCLLPERARSLELLNLHDIPAEYAAAMRARWRPQIPNGTSVRITGARSPGWIAENRDNPLRDWDTRGHISRARYAKAVAVYKTTRRAVLAALSDSPGDLLADRLARIGEEYAKAFNQLDGHRPFIETIEREELLDALSAIIDDAEATAGQDLSWARTALVDGAEKTRDW